jgi:serine/threonine-protein kinase
VVNKTGNDLKLIDFGLTVPDTPPFRQPGVRTGTPNYMAPEVVRRKPTSTLIDVFAFGVTAFEVCTYELPWPRGTGLDAMKHGQTDPIDIFHLRPNINELLAGMIHACLDADPSKRIDSMAKIVSLLKDIKSEDAS